MNEEQKPMILQTKKVPKRLLTHRNVMISQNVDWEIMAIISLKMRNPGFKIFIESGLRIVIIA